MINRPLRFTIEHLDDPERYILTAVGREPISLAEIRRAMRVADSDLEPEDDPRALNAMFGAQPRIRRRLYTMSPWRCTTLHGVVPAHFRGWKESNLQMAATWDMPTDFYGAQLVDVAIVGAVRPSPERLAELLQHERAGVRTLAMTWMATLPTLHRRTAGGRRKSR